jgi:DNA-directed RNA polymerase specialized sigma24 family protein
VAEGVFVQAYPMAKRAVATRAAAMHFGAADHEDMEQQVALGLLRALPQFDHGRACLATFVELVAQNQIASFLRNMWRYRLAGEPLENYEPDMVVARCNSDLCADVDRVLRCVGAFDRAVAHLLIDHSPTEAARQLGVSRASVYRSIWRLRAAFTLAGIGPIPRDCAHRAPR